MSRPICPGCKRLCNVVGSRKKDPDRIRYLGCRLCGYRADATEVVHVGLSGHRSSNYIRDSSGRFESGRDN